MFDILDELLRLIDARLAALRAASSPDYAEYRAIYARMADHYALCIERNAGRLL